MKQQDDPNDGSPIPSVSSTTAAANGNGGSGKSSAKKRKTRELTPKEEARRALIADLHAKAMPLFARLPRHGGFTADQLAWIITVSEQYPSEVFGIEAFAEILEIGYRTMKRRLDVTGYEAHRVERVVFRPREAQTKASDVEESGIDESEHGTEASEASEASSSFVASTQPSAVETVELIGGSAIPTLAESTTPLSADALPDPLLGEPLAGESLPPWLDTPIPRIHVRQRTAPQSRANWVQQDFARRRTSP